MNRRTKRILEDVASTALLITLAALPYVPGVVFLIRGEYLISSLLFLIPAQLFFLLSQRIFRAKA